MYDNYLCCKLRERESVINAGICAFFFSFCFFTGITIKYALATKSMFYPHLVDSCIRHEHQSDKRIIFVRLSRCVYRLTLEKDVLTSRHDSPSAETRCRIEYTIYTISQHG